MIAISRGINGDISHDELCYDRNESSPCIPVPNVTQCETPAKQYFDKVVLGIEKALLVVHEEQFNETTRVNRTYALTEFGNIGEIKWDITLCLLLSWVIVCLCLIKGIKSSGKVVYFSATFPYLLLITLMIYGLLQDGAIDGVKRLFIPKDWETKGFETLQDPQVIMTLDCSANQLN